MNYFLKTNATDGVLAVGELRTRKEVKLRNYGKKTPTTRTAEGGTNQERGTTESEATCE